MPCATVWVIRKVDEGLRAAVALRRAHPGLGVLVFSQYVETRYAAELLTQRSLDGAGGVGYLLKDRVADVTEFVEALARVASGGTALDPEGVSQLLGTSRRAGTLAMLSPREREVLSLMAEGRSNAALAAALVVSERAVEKHISNIFLKLQLPPSDAENRRVLAVLRYLESYWRTPVKPSAKPTQVRTLHLPPPAKTSAGYELSWLAVRFSLSRRVSSWSTVDRRVAVVTDV
jgi:DNA-binding NarL/FixJ family response regulator